MKRPNPLAPDLMTPSERRAELCRILAAGIVRARLNKSLQDDVNTGDSSLHFRLKQSGTTGPTDRRSA